MCNLMLVYEYKFCAEVALPTTLLASHETARRLSNGDRASESCCVLWKNSDGTVRFCDQPVAGGACKQHHCCRTHIHAPCIFMEDPKNHGSGTLKRFCHVPECHRLYDMSCFRGLSPICMLHERGRTAAGGPICVQDVDVELPADIVRPIYPLESLVAGGFGGSPRTSLKVCDVKGCERPCVGQKGVCSHHEVRTLPFCLHTNSVCTIYDVFSVHSENARSQ